MLDFHREHTMPEDPKDNHSPDEAASSDYKARPDDHLDQQSGERVPTPDPKDQTGDPAADNPAMRELRDRQSRRNSAEG
jgi:hypothetical protein